MPTELSTEAVIRARILAHVSDLLEAHWSQIVEIRDQEESVVTIGLNATVNAKTFADECEELLKDANQPDLPMA